MAYKPPLSEGDLFSLNLRSIRKWIKDNEGRIKARPNETVLYSGRMYDLDVVDQLTREDRDLFRGTPVYLTIEKHRKLHRDRNIPFHYETLEVVLSGIRDYPVLVDKDHQPQRFSNAFDFFNSLKSHADLLPNA